jgi:hypothetical protein
VRLHALTELAGESLEGLPHMTGDARRGADRIYTLVGVLVDTARAALAKVDDTVGRLR